MRFTRISSSLAFSNFARNSGSLSKAWITSFKYRWYSIWNSGFPYKNEHYLYTKIYTLDQQNYSKNIPTKSSESSISFSLSLWSSFFFSTGGAIDVCIIKTTKNSSKYRIFSGTKIKQKDTPTMRNHKKIHTTSESWN